MKETYIIKGMQFRSGDEIFYDIGSEGYPFGSQYTYRGFNSAKEAYDHIESARGQYVDMLYPEVCKVVFEPVDTSEFDQAKRRAKMILEEMSDEEIEAMRGMI